MSKDLLYRPDLEYDKNYYTEGNIYNTIESEDSTDDAQKDNLIGKLDNIEDLLTEIKTKLPFIPTDILDVFLPSFIIVDDSINDLLDNKDYIPKEPEIEDPGYEEIPDEKDDDGREPGDTDIPDDPFGNGDDVYIDTPIPEISIEDVIERQYTGDLIDIINDYLFNYNKTLDKYVTNVITFMSESKYGSLKIIKTKNLRDENLSHVSDYLVKSKIVLRQQLNLYKKMYDTEETMFHIRATKVAKEQLKRYSLNKRQEDINSLTKGGNDLLKESVMVSEKKYEENFYALYKYLNSSVILLDECMNTVIKQKQSLILLNNKEREN